MATIILSQQTHQTISTSIQVNNNKAIIRNQQNLEYSVDIESTDNAYELPKDSEWWKKHPEKRASMVWETMCKIGGWWGTGCPEEKELVAWLLIEEGATLSYYDKFLMAKGIRYRFTNFVDNDAQFVKQLSGFTSLYNPDGDEDLDQADWDLLLNPTVGIKSYMDIVNDVYSKELLYSDGMYIYWWSADEVIVDRNRWPGRVGKDYKQVIDAFGNLFYFSGIPDIRNCAMRGINCR